MIAAIDPDSDECGLAYYDGARSAIEWAGVCSPDRPVYVEDVPLTHIYVEGMDTHRKGKLSKLFATQHAGSVLAGRLAEHAGGPCVIKLVPAGTWIGSIRQALHDERLYEALRPDERVFVDRALRKHRREVLSACGLGMFVTGRIDRSGGPTR